MPGRPQRVVGFEQVPTFVPVTRDPAAAGEPSIGVWKEPQVLPRPAARALHMPLPADAWVNQSSDSTIAKRVQVDSVLLRFKIVRFRIRLNLGREPVSWEIIQRNTGQPWDDSCGRTGVIRNYWGLAGVVNLRRYEPDSFEMKINNMAPNSSYSNKIRATFHIWSIRRKLAYLFTIVLSSDVCATSQLGLF